jgi:hypothetical protein
MKPLQIDTSTAITAIECAAELSSGQDSDDNCWSLLCQKNECALNFPNSQSIKSNREND